MTITNQGTLQGCGRCGRDIIPHDPCVIAPTVSLCRPCANQLSNPQVMRLRDDTQREMLESGVATLTVGNEADDRTAFEEFMLRTSWETHLPQCPEGRLMVRADFCIDTGDIAYIFTNPRNDGAVVAACIEQPADPRLPDEPFLYYIQQENGEMPRVTRQQFRAVLQYLNPPSGMTWSFPVTPSGMTTHEQYHPVGLEHTPDFNRMLADHEWRSPNPRENRRLMVCSGCEGWMRLTTALTAKAVRQSEGLKAPASSAGQALDATDRESNNVTRVQVRLPLQRECYYMQMAGSLTPVSDDAYFGVPSKRVPRGRVEGPARRRNNPTRTG